MSSELHTVLRSAVPSDISPVNLNEIARRARRWRVEQFVAGASVVAMLAAGTAAGWAWSSKNGREQPQHVAATPTCISQTSEVLLLLNGDLTGAEVNELRELVEEHSDVVATTFRSSVEEFRKFKEQYANRPRLWKSLPRDALPAVVEVDVRDAPERSFKEIAGVLDHLPGVAWATFWDPEKDSSHPACGPPDPVASPSGAEKADAAASRTLGDLGRLCRSYDFYFKTETPEGTYRPVSCKAADDSPAVLIYGFDSPATRAAWLADHKTFWEGRIVTADAVVDVVKATLFDKVVTRVTPLDVVAPAKRFENGRIELTFAARVPALVPAPAAMEEVGTGEIIGVRQAWFRFLASDGRDKLRRTPVWVVSVRRCVPSYGGVHALPECAPDQRHVIIDAHTGRRLHTLEPKS